MDDRARLKAAYEAMTEARSAHDAGVHGSFKALHLREVVAP